MERLTFDGNFCDIARCMELPCPYNNNCTQRQVWERLKQYEDSGLSPTACEEARKIEDGLSEHDCSIERMVELMQADKDGRVVVLPAKEVPCRQGSVDRAEIGAPLMRMVGMCHHNHGICTAPETRCIHWMGTFCELDVNNIAEVNGGD